jgi:hypothetical protein
MSSSRAGTLSVTLASQLVVKINRLNPVTRPCVKAVLWWSGLTVKLKVAYIDWLDMVYRPRCAIWTS